MLKRAAISIVFCASLAPLWFFAGVYVVLPVYAAIAPWREERLERIIRRLVAFDAYITLLTDDPSTGSSDITYEIERGGRAATGAALVRAVTALPAAIALAAVGTAAILTWLFAAAGVLATGRYPDAVYRFHASVVGLGAQVLPYLGSLTEAYPRIAETRR